MMEYTNDIAARLESAATLLERTLAWLEERQAALAGQVEKISATVEQSRREDELAERLCEAERVIAELRASAAAAHPSGGPQPAAAIQQPLLRKTAPAAMMPAAASEMMAKHGMGEGPVDGRALDAALAGLSLEQRIAVKSQLLRSGAIS